MYVNHMHAWYRWGLEEAQDPLELQLQVIEGHHMISGKQTWVLSESSKCS